MCKLATVVSFFIYDYDNIAYCIITIIISNNITNRLVISIIMIAKYIINNTNDNNTTGNDNILQNILRTLIKESGSWHSLETPPK